VPKDKIGGVSGNIGFIAEIFVLIMDPFLGLAFDILGRKWPVVLGLAMSGIGILAVPFG
jgi:hypothetical protein